MKTLLFLLVLLTTNVFAQEWMEVRKPVVPMEGYPDKRVPNKIKYISLIRDNKVYFNWVITTEKKCVFLVEESKDCFNYKMVDFVTAVSVPVDVWYGINEEIHTDYIWFRVVQVFEDQTRYTYPTKEVTSKYEVTEFDRSVPNF